MLQWPPDNYNQAPLGALINNANLSFNDGRGWSSDRQHRGTDPLEMSPDILGCVDDRRAVVNKDNDQSEIKSVPVFILTET